MPDRYSRTQIVLHWAVVALLALQYLAHDGMEDAWRAFRQTGTAETGAGALLHIVSGITVLVLVLWRLKLRASHGAPPRPEGSALLGRLADATHWTLYGLLLLVPASGMAAWFLGAPAAGEAHEVLKTLLLIVLLLHVAAALMHQFVLRDNLIARMMPKR